MSRKRINNLISNRESREFIYPDDDLRFSTKEAGAYVGGGILETLFRAAPLEALMRVGIKGNAVRKRPDATPGMHEAYLNNKYGKADWDTYINRNDGTGYNSAYEYVEKDYGTASELVRENKRFAGKALSDEWMADVKGYGQAQDALEEVVEQNRQRGVVDAIHGKSEAAAFMDPSNPSRTTEQQLSYDLLYNGTMPSAIPPDRVFGKDVSADVKDNVSGIAGRFKPDSEIRRDVKGSLSENGTLNLDRNNTRTEILSPTGVENTFAAWKPLQQRQNQTSRTDFNRFANEYYGQQGLKIMKNLDYDDRLIAGSSGLNSAVTREKGDFVYPDESGNQRVTDNQTRSASAGNPNSLDLNLIKQSNMGYANNDEFVSDIYRHAQLTGSNDLDTIMQSISETKGLPITSNYNEALSGGIRPGKHLADAPNMSQAWYADDDKINDVLYSILDDPSSKYGMLPSNMIGLDNSTVRNHISKMIQNRELTGKDLRVTSTGKVDLINVPYDPKDGAKYQNNGFNQISEEYTLDKPVPKREIPKRKPVQKSVPVKPKGSPEMEAKRKASALERARARQEMIKENFKNGFIDNYDDTTLAERHMQNTNVRYGENIDDFAF